MRNKILYEWDYETLSEDGDIIDHNHKDKLAAFTKEDITTSLVLIRDEVNDIDGLQDRTWAYVEDGKLPDYFSDAAGNTLYHVPERFKVELALYHQ